MSQFVFFMALPLPQSYKRILFTILPKIPDILYNAVTLIFLHKADVRKE